MSKPLKKRIAQTFDIKCDGAWGPGQSGIFKATAKVGKRVILSKWVALEQLPEFAIEVAQILHKS